MKEIKKWSVRDGLSRGAAEKERPVPPHGTAPEREHGVDGVENPEGNRILSTILENKVSKTRRSL